MAPRRGAAAQARYERNMNWRKLYEEGKTLQQISDMTTGDYVATISRGIQTVGGTMRPTGYRKGDKDKNKQPKGILSWVNATT